MWRIAQYSIVFSVDAREPPKFLVGSGKVRVARRRALDRGRSREGECQHGVAKHRFKFQPS